MIICTFCLYVYCVSCVMILLVFFTIVKSIINFWFILVSSHFYLPMIWLLSNCTLYIFPMSSFRCRFGFSSLPNRPSLSSSSFHTWLLNSPIDKTHSFFFALSKTLVHWTLFGLHYHSLYRLQLLMLVVQKVDLIFSILPFIYWSFYIHFLHSFSINIDIPFAAFSCLTTPLHMWVWVSMCVWVFIFFNKRKFVKPGYTIIEIQFSKLTHFLGDPTLERSGCTRWMID